MLLTNEQLRTILVGTGLISPAVFDRTLEEANQARVPITQLLVDRDLISEENLGRLTADALQLPFIILSKTAISQDVLQIIPEVYARKNKVIVFAKDQSGIKLAMADPLNKEIIEFISKKTGEPVQVYLATEADIERALRLYGKNYQQSLEEMLQHSIAEAGKAVEKDVPISKAVDLLIEYAFRNGASDIHIEPEKNYSLIRFRIDGVLHDILTYPRNLHDRIVTRIKVLSRLRTDEHLSAQDGKMQYHSEGEDVDIRVSIVPIVDGEKVVMRLLSSRSRQFSLTTLGFDSKDLEKVKEGFNKPFGMVLSTGPTGSGKTTTIYAILKILNTRDKNIATIEDPVEYDIDGINQIQVNPKTNLTFADGLRAILRQDPDIIFVGEIRDRETAGIAVNSAMTGHLVLSTLHTNDAATTLPRLIDMGIEPFLVSSTVNVIIGQRLVRRVCEKCRTSQEVEVSEFARFIPNEILEKYLPNKDKVRVYYGAGCPVCHKSGYNGRIGIFEVLVVTEEIKELINQKADADTIKKKAIEQGMTPMLEDGFKKVLQGVTSLDEILRVTKI